MDRIDEATLTGLREFYGDPDLEWGDFETGGIDRRKLMRAALLAGVKVLLGPVVEQWRKDSDDCAEAADMLYAGRALALYDCADQLERIYAPSLGEGDGR